MGKEEAVIMGLLSLLGSTANRTKLVKLVYLIDNLHAEHLGESLTGFSYCWDKYGPNAVDDKIVSKLDELRREGHVSMTASTSFGNPEYLYAATGSLFAKDLELTSDDWLFIRAVVKEYGKKPLWIVKDAAYATAPMQGIKQNDLLEWRSNKEIERRHERVLSNTNLMKQIAESLRLKKEGAPGVSLEELKAGLGK